MTDDIVLYADQSLPETGVLWEDGNGAVIDFSTGYTWKAELLDFGNVARLTKTTNVFGYVGATGINVSVRWATGDLTGLSGRYRLRITATQTDGRKRVFRPDALPIVVVMPVPSAP